jgi:hypothetical protein
MRSMQQVHASSMLSENRMPTHRAYFDRPSGFRSFADAKALRAHIHKVAPCAYPAVSRLCLAKFASCPNASSLCAQEHVATVRARPSGRPHYDRGLPSVATLMQQKAVDSLTPAAES